MRAHTLKSIAITAMAITASIWISGCELVKTADLLLINGRVYTLTWDEPGLDGTPAGRITWCVGGWRPPLRANCECNATSSMAVTA